MKRFFTLLLLAPVCAWSQQGFHIKGNLEGIKDSTEVHLSAQNNAVVASAYTKKGLFDLAGQLPEPQLMTLTIGKNGPLYLYVENGNITLTAPAVVEKTVVKGPAAKTKTVAKEPDMTQLKVEGSQSQVDFIQFQNAFMPLFNQVNSVVTQANSAADPGQRDGLMKTFDTLKRTVDALVEQYINAKPHSYVSPFVLGNTAQLLDNPVVLNDRFRRLDSAVQLSNIGKSLAAYIAQNLVGAIGSEAVEFSQPDTTGKPVALSSLRGKYVLLDFWASWCRPCRAENPNVVRAFQKFHSKNFTILGVSLDQQKDAWINAINHDGLTWTHVSDLQQWNNAVARMYGVQGIPQNFLIDPQGRIVGKNLRGEDLERKLCELLGCN